MTDPMLDLLKRRVTDAMNTAQEAILNGGMKFTIEDYRYRQGQLDALRQLYNQLDDDAKRIDEMD